MRTVIFALLIAIGVSATVVRPAHAQQTPGYSTITTDQLVEMLKHKDFVLVNVHIPYEGELPQTDALIPFDQIAGNLDRLPDKNSEIILYCRSGRMSEIAGAELARLGYTNVAHLEGGFNAWADAGQTLLQVGGETTSVWP